MTKCCSLCGQEIPESRAGVRLSPLKARIFDVIQRAGKDGIEGGDLFDLFMRQRGVQYNVLKTHVCQINERLVSTDYQIEVTRNGRGYGTYRLKRTQIA